MSRDSPHQHAFAGDLRVAIAQRFFVTNCHRERPIHVQESHSSAADCSSPDEVEIVCDRNVLVLAIFPGVEQANHIARMWVSRLGPCSLAERAGNTSEGKVVELSRAAVSTRLDVVDVKGGLLASLR